MQVGEVVVPLEHGVEESCEARRRIGFQPGGQRRDPVEDLLGPSPLLGQDLYVLSCPLDVHVDLVVGVEENESA